MPAARGSLLRWTLTATAAAALAACGGGGGGGEEPQAPANQAPTVTLTGPAASTTVTAGTAVTITATAADSDGTVARVEFYDGTTKLGEDTTSPYSFSWTNPATGAHTITVRAIDNAGATATSAAVTLTVNAAPANRPPTVAITAPVTNFKANAPASVKLVANAADPDGTVAEVKFYRINPAAPVFDASTLMGAGALVGGAYELNQTLAAGTYDIAAVVKDNAGASTTSATVRVIVNALPTAAITAPTAGASLKVGTTTTLRATAGDADGSIAKVEFFVDGGTTPIAATRVGTTNEYTASWAVLAGPHTLVARATDNDGATFSTASVSVNGAANASPTVTLDNPTAGANVPTTLVLTASAADSDGTVASVQFLNGTTVLGTGTFDAATSKYRLQLPLTAAQAGTYNITARATDDLGAQTTTASKSITVAANVPPAVAITSAAAVTLPVAAATGAVTLTATATDTDGIAKVEFFNGATKLGEATASPYTYNWTAVAGGTYTITARATDTVGSVTTSAAQSLVVTPNTEGPWANLNAAQTGGITTAPNAAIEAFGTLDAIQVLSGVGLNKVAPIWRAAMAQAAQSIATVDFTLTPSVPCAGGGSMKVLAGTGTSRLLALDNCVLGGFTIYGGGDLAPYAHPGVPAGIGSEIVWTPTAGGFTLAIDGVRVTGNGAPEAGTGPYPRNALVSTTVSCTGSGATLSCLTTFAGGYTWGNNLAWTGYGAGTLVSPDPLQATDDTFTLNGTHRPTFAATARNIRYENFTATGGRAIVYGNNGYSVVTRVSQLAAGVLRMQVVRSIGSGPEVFECQVDAVSGEWSCVQIP